MKFSRLSLVAMAALATLSSNAFAADSLADAFKNGKVAGEIRAYYFSRDIPNDHKGHEDIFATGLMLNYVTDSFMGFRAGATFQSSATPFADDDGKAMFTRDMWAQGAQLSEAYLAYTLGKTDVKVGRMYMGTPLIAGSGSRLIRESFEGALITNKDIPDTTLGAVYINKFQARTNRDGDIGEFDSYFDGMYSLYAINKSIAGLTLTGAWAKINDYVATRHSDLDIYNAEVVYANKMGAFGYNLSGQYWFNHHSSVAAGQDDTIDGYGLKAGASYADISAYVAYSKISDDNTPAGQLVHGAGNGSDLIYTNSIIGSYNYTPDMKAYAGGLDYKITPASTIGTVYTYTNTKNEEVSYTGFYASYTFSGELKGLSVSAQYETIGKDGDGDQFRFRGSYKF
ncbi:OprD family outer membrane porin [Sulfurospirillum barnesii]|uniref:Outer membrane porin, OprD family n=1 Tax=Sulfurospirillum barnesii (strain ATCC 700032 / DSM 10660 / SES-3) TaxID=760154 RepID=I3XTU2_SULBS|nr:OprD family outer membrane porin [Sulfurospirillum barnesii]AFL67366.1 outer membrane porin, OprD family [Sulfurospirillum barnesii SES-3]